MKNRNSRILGEKLKKRREELNYSRQELASILYVTTSLISKWEKGERSFYHHIDSISEVLKIPIDELLPNNINDTKLSKDKNLNTAILLSMLIGIALIIARTTIYHSIKLFLEDKSYVEEVAIEYLQHYTYIKNILDIAFFLSFFITIIVMTIKLNKNK